MKTNFSIHAYERVSGRINMSHSELAELLDNNLAINIGNEVGNNKAHKLFYSALDRMCFVAIQDVKTGTVVTVLPLDYHENICWSVSIDAQNQAKGLVAKDTYNSSDTEVLHTNAIVFRVSAFLIDSYGKYIKAFKLGSWPCAPYENNVEFLVEDQQFKDFLVEKIRGKRSEIEKHWPAHIPTIAIRMGKKGFPTFFSTSELMESNA